MNHASDSFQHEFIRAIYGVGDSASPLAQLTGQPGFKVYRNTVLKASVDALAANYPTIVRLVGEEWFRSAALIHACAEPPESVCLIEYGRGFTDFLSAFGPAAELPYLGEVARLDRLWTECHIAADEAPLEAAMLAALGEVDLLQSALRPRASIRWRWCADQPAYSIWQANREQRELADELSWDGEGALLSRIDGQVVWQAAGPGMCAFLDACAAGENLQTATAKAVDAEPALDVARLLGTLIHAEAFASPFTPTR
ncbi:DNA-binding domain-containing protein [Herbaspirillum rhizosphaerae]|uniref:HvfC/BufC N-terminal domain-containing protein n=1 Tax=Herbaspirillum rhizosphaerae TaxID=346179 RepID=UPI00067C1BF4|nr:DNA-binding domain-containing protein [Herbaspirillum rhizosphaerae]